MGDEFERQALQVFADRGWKIRGVTDTEPPPVVDFADAVVGEAAYTWERLSGDFEDYHF
jgi:hypothetical protein